MYDEEIKKLKKDVNALTTLYSKNTADQQNLKNTVSKQVKLLVKHLFYVKISVVIILIITLILLLNLFYLYSFFIF